MTVRVNKSSFNIREKLSELGRKFGLKGSELAAAETVQEARDLVSAGRKNMVINGDVRISQRYGTTATTTTSGGFVIDRHRCEVGSAGATTQQQVTDAPPGFYNSMKITVTGTDTSVSAGDYHYFRHIIEGNNINHLNWGSSNAKTVTLSFWVKSSITGDHGGALWNSAFTRSFPFNYRINSANAWEYKSITVPGCTDGPWETGINRGINIGFVQLSGSTYTGPPNQWNSSGDVAPTSHVNLLATNGATWYITGIQLEVGRNATDFEHRSYGEELALCQRYCETLERNENETLIGIGLAYTTTRLLVAHTFKVPKRSSPSLSIIGNSNNVQMLQKGGGWTNATSVIATTGRSMCRIDCTCGSAIFAAGDAGEIRIEGTTKLVFHCEI